MRDALKRSMGEASFAEIRERFDKRVQSGDLIEVESKSPARAFTTEQMIGYERDNSRRDAKRTESGQSVGQYRDMASHRGETSTLEHQPTRGG